MTVVIPTTKITDVYYKCPVMSLSHTLTCSTQTQVPNTHTATHSHSSLFVVFASYYIVLHSRFSVLETLRAVQSP